MSSINWWHKLKFFFVSGLGLLMWAIIFLLLWWDSETLSLLYGMGQTVNMDKGFISVYLEADELPRMSPDQLKQAWCERRFLSASRGGKPPNAFYGESAKIMTYEIYRRTNTGLNTLLISFPSSECLERLKNGGKGQ